MMKPACEVQEGDRTGDWMVVESRPYTPNPDVMWFIFWKRVINGWANYPTPLRMDDCSFVKRDEKVEIQYEAYEIVELP